MPFTTREERDFAAKTPRETSLSSRELRTAWDQRIKDEAVFGARITHRAYIDAIKKRLVEVIGGTLSPQEAERRLKETLRDLGYSPEGGFKGDGKGIPPAKPGDIRDLSSSRRIQLIIDTNVKRARSMGQVAASENPMTMMSLPAWKLTRTGARKKPRGDWNRRWAAAGAKCGWKGACKRQMIALKTSPIWQALADGAGGYEDTLGSPFPPFAFGSGLAWVNVRRKEWQRICQTEGIPDGQEDITAKAKEFMKKGGGTTAEAMPTISTDVPPMGDKPQGVPNPIMAQPKPTQPAPPPAAYIPDYSERNDANDAIDEALAEINRVIADAEKIVKALTDKAARTEDAGDELELNEAARSLKSAMTELASLKGRVVNYGSAIESTPPPRNKAEQSSYDLTMRRYASSAKSVARRARRMVDFEKSRMAARGITPDGD